MTLRFEGTFTALVTPFKEDLSIDWGAFERLVEGQIAAGVAGIVPCGTTGESPALERDEQRVLIERSVALAKGRCLVVAGTGTNATRSTIEASKAALGAGADAVMVVVPYYNKPTQEGLCRHYVEVASATGAPMIVYNIPGRSGVDLGTDTLARICEAAPNVVAIKEATGNVLRAQDIARTLGSRLGILSGDDALTLPMISVGARGVISVTSNLYPAEVARVTALALEGAWANAQREHFALCGVHEAMFVEANPSPIKAALAMKGQMSDAVRGPLARASESARARVRAAIRAYEAR